LAQRSTPVKGLPLYVAVPLPPGRGAEVVLDRTVLELVRVVVPVGVGTDEVEEVLVLELEGVLAAEVVDDAVPGRHCE
jgi:hypothetical protein